MAGLAGALFVAVSIKSEALARSRSLASRAGADPGAVHGLGVHRDRAGGTAALPILASLVGGVINAWLFLPKVPAGPPPPGESASQATGQS